MWWWIRDGRLVDDRFWERDVIDHSLSWSSHKINKFIISTISHSTIYQSTISQSTMSPSTISQSHLIIYHLICLTIYHLISSVSQSTIISYNRPVSVWSTDLLLFYCFTNVREEKDEMMRWLMVRWFFFSLSSHNLPSHDQQYLSHKLPSTISSSLISHLGSIWWVMVEMELVTTR